MAGVTRDRVGSLVQLGDDDDPRFIELIDTGGIGMVDRDDLSEDVERQIDTAMNEADLILFVVDIRDEPDAAGRGGGQRLRYLKTPVILVMNKADDPEFDHRGAEFYKLGRGKPIAVSAQQNRNKKQLLQLIEEMLPAADGGQAGRRRDEDRRGGPAQHRQVDLDQHAGAGRADDRLGAAGHHPRLGRRPFRARRRAVPGDRHRRDQATLQDPRQPRLLLGPPRRAVDPPGRRRPAVPRPHPGHHPARQATGRLHRPGTQAVHLHDQQVGPDGERSGRPVAGEHGPVRQPGPACVPHDELHADGVHHGQDRQERQGARSTSRKSLFKQSQKRVGTGTLNRIVREAVEAHPPASRENRTPRIYYATQVGVAPPTIVLFVNSTRLFDPTYQRYLLNVFREKLPFRDIPIKLYMRSASRCEPGASSSPDVSARDR